jgi:positive regulator of sigma E activity
MFTETGIVKKNDGKYTEIQLGLNSKCGGCHACHTEEQGQLFLRIRNSLNAKIGDTVEIEVKPRWIFQPSFLLFAFTIFFFIFGMGAAGNFSIDHWAQISLGILSGSLGLGMVLWVQRKTILTSKNQATMVRIIQNDFIQLTPT